MTFGELKVGAIFIMDIDGKSTKCTKVGEFGFRKYGRKTLLMALPSIEVLTLDASAAKSGYNAEAVDKAIAKSKPKIGSKEAKAIHGLLKGRTAPAPAPKVAKAEDKLTEALARVAACKHEHAELAPSGHVNCYACGLRVNPPSAEGPVTGYSDQHGNVVGLHAKKTKL
jgi:hypothetical protein